jgi:hypothetical protein
VRLVDLLDELTDDRRASRVGELGELAQMIVDDAPCPAPLERSADEQRPLGGCGDGNRFSGYCRILSGRRLWS